MKTCEQTKGQSVFQHGISVKNYLFDLLNHLKFKTPLKYDWNLPSWIYDNRDQILESLPTDKTLKLYATMHDIGKPHCLTIDDEGKKHFPNHAEISYQIFTQVFNDPIAAKLIRQDMDIHLLRSDGVEKFCQNPHALILLITGLAEIHSNAKMFGGTNSISFRIKYKCITQRGKQIFNQLKKQK